MQYTLLFYSEEPEGTRPPPSSDYRIVSKQRYMNLLANEFDGGVFYVGL